jgi:hypothetical protein
LENKREKNRRPRIFLVCHAACAVVSRFPALREEGKMTEPITPKTRLAILLPAGRLPPEIEAKKEIRQLEELFSDEGAGHLPVCSSSSGALLVRKAPGGAAEKPGSALHRWFFSSRQDLAGSDTGNGIAPEFLAPLFHHQGKRGRHRPGIVRGAWYRPRAWRACRRRQ